MKAIKEKQFCGSVAIVDDEPDALYTYSVILKSNGIKDITCIQDAREVPVILKERSFSVILLDLSMPYISGFELLKYIVVEYPEIPVIVITAINEINSAVECIKAGAFDYLVKPVEKNRLITSIHKALEINRLKEEITGLKESLLLDDIEHKDAFSEIVTVNQKMKGIFKYVEVIARTDQPVLITGETGTGKELIARAVHRVSGKKGEFVAVNIAGLDDTMFSDTLFGHRKGAFTGAMSNREGLIARARGGTLFLDEIGDMSEASQIKLLRVIQENVYYPLGSDMAKNSDARIIVATNQDINEMVSSGKFRKDLFYRLKAHHVHLPPLRERKDDIPVLVDHFVKEASISLGKKLLKYPEELIVLLMNHLFPGNVRELKMMIYDAVTRCKSSILSLESFKDMIDVSNSIDKELKSEIVRFYIQMRFPDKLPTLKEMEQILIDEALRRAQGNQGLASSMLGITRQALNRRIRKTNAP
ncbi:MAG TPA: sigma-54 dependent transcriptional regulator [Thermodesulfovibrio thiophilus]|mgnify:CR=1 FL=1|uniref:sigma-54-dependent transcriptional regulator n=1 Tax=Thermodesulfovibrio thiophilus TaxID=340095 RepID=UPI00041B896F|nr:sigma-54 dependent transcriptional regulator [Thermodesulfovibrio thiophilus]HOA82820.1 sigma-54 dependent transcriptional regulator [Thermodesulfovibrio thiophilus]HQA03398.1 sigma-54 dependent transcriptional regulator [Thermodesulfovibrio thiophilus]HQD35878.1 sigma-54 dependent transcriptional regulator [Thermodesulfovibrio thiophilus]